MNIEQFMQSYKEAWERRDETMFSALFASDGEYHNTPFAVQTGHEQLAEYWRRVKLQEDVQVAYEVLARGPVLARDCVPSNLPYQFAFLTEGRLLPIDYWRYFLVDLLPIAHPPLGDFLN